MSGSPSKNFAIAVTAIDKTAPVLGKVDAALAKFDKPLKKISAGIGDIAGQARFDSISKGFGQVETSVSGVVDKVAALIPQIGILSGLGSAAGIVAFGASFAETGANVLRTSKFLGVASDELQRLRGAAEQAGLEAGTLDSAMQSFGDTLENIRFNPLQKLALKNLGVELKLDASGGIDERAALGDIANALAGKRAGVQRKYAGILGIEGILPLIGEGDTKLRSLEQGYDRTAAAMNPSALSKGDELYGKLKNLGTAAAGTANALGGQLAPALNTVADAMTNALSAWTQYLNTGMSFGAKLAVLASPTSPASAAAPLPTLGPAGSSDAFSSVNQTMRELGAGRGAFLRDMLGPQGPQATEIRVRFENAPPGMRVVTTGTAPVRTEIVGTAHVMPNGGP